MKRTSPSLAAACLALAFLAVSPALSADESWQSYQAGRRLFEERRFGEALNAFSDASRIRRERFAAAAAKIQTALELKEAIPQRDSLTGVIDALAKRDLIAREYAAIKDAAGGSLRKEAELLLARDPSDAFAGFLDSLLLVLEQRPASALRGSVAVLRRVVAELGVYPEADFWIGKVYLAEGELRLAELQFRRAYDMSASLEIPEERFAILEALAVVYRAAGNWRAYEDGLKAIADSGELFSESRRYLREAMERNLARDGFDRFMILYRVAPGPWTRASAELGSFYLESGRPQALIQLAGASNALLARCIERIREKEPGYAYRELGELLSRMEGDRELRRFAEESGVYRALYELGEALAVQGHRESARGIWRVLAGRPGLAPWAARSAAALARPPDAAPPVPAAAREAGRAP